jgi:hypothetical protein
MFFGKNGLEMVSVPDLLLLLDEVIEFGLHKMEHLSARNRS